MNRSGIKLLADAGFSDNQVGNVFRGKPFKRMHHLGMCPTYTHRAAAKRFGIVGLGSERFQPIKRLTVG